MIIKCIDTKGLSALRINELYDVIEVMFDGASYLFRLIGSDDSSPGLFPKECFEVIDNSLSSSNVMKFDSNKSFSITHKAFNSEGFWEKYFNSDSNAMSVFDSVFPPLSKIDIKLKDLPHNDVSWTTIQFLLSRKWCDVKLAIDLATAKIVTSSIADEIKLAGLSTTDEDNVKEIVCMLVAEDTKLDFQQVKNIVLKWYKSNYTSEFIQSFTRLLEEDIRRLND